MYTFYSIIRNNTSKCSQPGTIDTLGHTILGGGACPVHHRMFSSIPGLDAPHASSITHLPTARVTAINIFRCGQMSPGGNLLAHGDPGLSGGHFRLVTWMEKCLSKHSDFFLAASEKQVYTPPPGETENSFFESPV